jgi:hypothetical protein
VGGRGIMKNCTGGRGKRIKKGVRGIKRKGLGEEQGMEYIVRGLKRNGVRGIQRN